MKSIDVSKLFARSELKFRVSMNPIDRDVNSRTNSLGAITFERISDNTRE
jgi:hypothetical protein